ncbi:MAG: hypothetical protein ACKVQC_08300 [Elusimicrobiota bacterium]
MKKEQGFFLPMIVGIIFVGLILLPALVTWVQHDSKQAVKVSKSNVAFNLAETGADRGMWKLKSSTSTFAQAKVGQVITGYNFDTVYTDDVTGSGGKYRIKFSSGPNSREVTVLAEGKDIKTGETRAVKAVFKNQTFGGAMISGGVITWANAFSAHWGPIMAHNNINITDANAAQDFFPRKFSRQVVQCTIGSYDRDTNGLTAPNTDSTEWWSDYSVPELPILDFATLRSSASATSTLNFLACSKMGSYTGTKYWSGNCNVGGKNHNGLLHFQNPWNQPNARKQYVFYWDGDVIWTGSTGSEGAGIWGTVVVRGNFTNYTGDNYSYTGSVPSSAYEEYSKISKTVGDTSAKNEYPADDGSKKNRSTFSFGGETWTGGKSPPPAGNTDVGIRGLLYIGGDWNIEGAMDVNGVIWVAGNVSKAVGAERTIVFYNDALDVPTLNVILTRQSWDEVSPTASTW